MQTACRRTNPQILELANVRITPLSIGILHREHVIAEGSSELQFLFGRHSFEGRGRVERLGERGGGDAPRMCLKYFGLSALED